MKSYSKKNIEELSKKDRLHLINSITGIKPANLISTIDSQGNPNLAIFSSVIHLGSNPPLIGFVIRPSGEVPRHTYENIQERGIYAINAIPTSLVEKAHYSSAKFDREVNEFERLDIEPYACEEFEIPFVKESPIKLGMKFREELDIKLNDTKLIIGEVVYLEINESDLNDFNALRLDKASIAGISGLNTYYSLNKIDAFPYARVNEVPKFK
ncbi:flavin reductase family protein [Flavobacteriaceae bacterium]|nr:flavin reductase family protein [Flavobacteriaceae bacterium]